MRRQWLPCRVVGAGAECPSRAHMVGDRGLTGLCPAHLPGGTLCPRSPHHGTFTVVGKLKRPRMGRAFWARVPAQERLKGERARQRA